MTTQRLPWQRNPEGGFVAYPDGVNRPDHRAEIAFSSVISANKWQWRAICDDAVIAGGAEDRQTAADQVTEAWPKVTAKAAVLAEQAAAEAALRTMVQRMCLKGDLSLSLFAIPESDSKRLTHIIWLVRDVGGVGGPAQPLLDACSAELYRRRTEAPPQSSTGDTTAGSGGPVRR